MKANLDLNLVYVAESLFRHQNVSRAAKELNVTQSSVSHALNRLRDHFGDPLFVRVAKGMAPTEGAKALRQAIEDLAERGRELSRRPDSVDMKRVRARFTIATTDYVEVLLVPALLVRLRTEAPGIQISLRPTGGELPKAELESGEFDVACAGFYRDLPEGFYQTKLFEDVLAVGCRKGHPLAKGPLTLERFRAADQALITLQGDFKTTARDRNVVYGSYSFTGMAWTIARTDLLLPAPRRLLEHYREHFPIQILESPAPRRIEIRMLWHALTHRDPVKKWLRGVVAETLAAL